MCHCFPQQVAVINLLISVDNSSKQMQQTSGSSFLHLTDGDECAEGEVAEGEVAVVVVPFLLMVCRNCERLRCLIGRVGCVTRWGGEDDDPGRRREEVKRSRVKSRG